MQRAITFDFHDTLVHCDEWFQLEVFHFPSAFLAWHALHYAELTAPEAGAELDRAYRRLRSSIIQHGHELTAERSIAVVYGQAGIHVDDERLEQGVRELMRAAMQGARPVPGALEAVRNLSDRGTPLAVVSSAVYHPFLEWALEKLGILDRFGAVVTSAACGYYKSRPEIFWHALSAVGATPRGSIHIGDSARFDVDGSARAGMRSVWLDHGSSGPPSTTPALRVGSLEGIAPLLFDLLSGPAM